MATRRCCCLPLANHLFPSTHTYSPRTTSPPDQTLHSGLLDSTISTRPAHARRCRDRGRSGRRRGSKARGERKPWYEPTTAIAMPTVEHRHAISTAASLRNMDIPVIPVAEAIASWVFGKVRGLRRWIGALRHSIGARGCSRSYEGLGVVG